VSLDITAGEDKRVITGDMVYIRRFASSLVLDGVPR